MSRANIVLALIQAAGILWFLHIVAMYDHDRQLFRGLELRAEHQVGYTEALRDAATAWKVSCP